LTIRRCSILAFLSFTTLVFLLAPSARAQADSGLPPAPVLKILKARCARCHGGQYPSAGMSFESNATLASLAGRPSGEKPELKIIDPSDPDRSYLLAKVRGEAGIAGKRMPLDGDPLPASDIAVLAAWARGLKGMPPGASADPAPAPAAKPPFWGVSVVNLPTTTGIDPGRFLVRIFHRFSAPVSSGYDAFYGFDSSAFVLVGFGYGLTDRLSLTLDRANVYQEYDLGAHYLVASQGEALPFSLAVHAGVGLATATLPDRGRFDTKNFKMYFEASFVRQVTDRLSLLVVPAYASNANHWQADRDGTFSIGFGGRYMIFEDISLLAEWIPVLAGYKDQGNGWAFGLEKKIGGHVFHVFVLNSGGLTPPQYLPGGDLLLKNGDFRIGFNIYRTF
jgi:hypothetical protein